MPTIELKTPFWDENGRLYRPGSAVELPQSVADALAGKSPAPATKTGGTLDGVQFASDEARKAAEEAGLTAADFEGAKATGADGGYTKPDVRALTEAKG